ncbi:proteic killer suppression protein [Luteibacter sp. Sphag1AF]|uniref:type II toxin-antitoxin system RelE/ParE family toxin n=1 Tax=Luteibacter sp. Sphag1AF TaxID=2587031 RepID=UPI001622E874|nr:type II toxin-antitoxin system RelE/ParE family toxin [Luteibacter sp. Sphag1AF]MBB3226816.1 proteic killer suppression protein [Luteibacter sp. Sphag1AF]
MIRSFKGKRAAELFAGRCPKVMESCRGTAERKLAYLDAASTLEDLRAPPGNALHALTHDRAGQHSIRINGQYRVCFRWDQGDAFDVEIVDYH